MLLPVLKLTFGNVTMLFKIGNESAEFGIAEALTKCSWNRGSIAVSTL